MSEDIRYILDWILTVGLAVGVPVVGWVCTLVFNRLRELKNEVKESAAIYSKQINKLNDKHIDLEKTILRDYATKQDMKDSIQPLVDLINSLKADTSKGLEDLKVSVNALYDKLDNKQDK